MKKLLIIIATIVIIFNINSTCYGAEDNTLRASFDVEDVSGTNFKEITITPYRYINNRRIEEDEDDEFYIYLPSGYQVIGKSASFIVDKDGKYPFTIYYGRNPKTIFYTVKDIDEDDDDDNKYSNKDDRDDIFFDYELKYDYEKKQVLFYMNLDKVRSVVTPDNKTTISNEINYYLNKLENNVPFSFTIYVDDEKYDYKVIKQGEFYLLITLSPINYDDYSTIVKYSGYNFTDNDNYTTIPSMDIYDDNGNYEVLVKSDTNSQELFNFNITGIDYRRPDIDISFLNDYTFELDVKDDFGLDYLITFDGKYIPISKGKDDIKEFNYKHNTIINYDGIYYFTVVDKAGNRSVASTKITSRRRPRKHSLDYDVHDYKYTEDLFENKGLKYKKTEETASTFEILIPAYMNGVNSTNFNPDSPITRAEMVTIFCRINDLPYDTTAYLKNKFTDIDNHWARDYISMGSKKRYVSGYKDKTFRPDSNVTRAEFCEMLSKISSFKSKINALPATSNFNFSDINGHWAKSAIIKISNRDLVSGNGNYFYPDKPITRGEVVHAINNLYNYSPSDNELVYINSLYNKYYNFKDIYYHKYYNDIIISVVGMYREIID
ncbi:S-layer homology domain-containing protein [Sedimentibacter sp. MB31-C6]|uniref:S-layer homology domain-containing protein n=1 Tax=Sedimentibacter sp. MB31-C6 TaxID=3109366 RepID=UPI002DDDAAF3|nr:S-layer homology domain-containing protein [Sedimentibacter sp. MB36-C1]WSI04960.1 S-layer homology domain-containing protein [Sedimentibacter sp. MB36-C1]